jgi:very-short-patch-repair endonuclease
MLKANYNKSLKQHSQDLRKDGTLGEVLLWQHLRSRQMHGYRFNRQKPLGPYIVDFYCNRLNLVIEIDGSSHDHKSAREKDAGRDKDLAGHGVSVLRFSEAEVRFEITNVLERIESWIVNQEGLGKSP